MQLSTINCFGTILHCLHFTVLFHKVTPSRCSTFLTTGQGAFIKGILPTFRSILTLPAARTCHYVVFSYNPTPTLYWAHASDSFSLVSREKFFSTLLPDLFCHSSRACARISHTLKSRNLHTKIISRTASEKIQERMILDTHRTTLQNSPTRYTPGIASKIESTHLLFVIVLTSRCPVFVKKLDFSFFQKN